MQKSGKRIPYRYSYMLYPIFILLMAALIIINYNLYQIYYGEKILDSSITKQIELQQGWDKIYPTKVSNNLYDIWDKEVVKPSDARWAVVDIELATKIFKELCDTYEIKHPDKITQDKEYLDSIELQEGLDGINSNIGGRTELRKNEKYDIIFDETIWLITVFHEFYHYLDLRLNNDNWNMSVDSDDICDYSGNTFYRKYYSRLWEVKDKRK